MGPGYRGRVSVHQAGDQCSRNLFTQAFMSATKRFLLMLQTRAKANPSMSTRALQEQQEQAEARLCVRGHWHMLARALMLPPHPFCTMVKQTGLLRTHHNMPSHLISCHTPTANKTSSSARRRTGTRVPGLCVCGLCVYPLYLCNTCFPLLSVGCVVQRASTWWCVCPVGPKQRPVYMWIIAFGLLLLGGLSKDRLLGGLRLFFD